MVGGSRGGGCLQLNNCPAYSLRKLSFDGQGREGRVEGGRQRGSTCIVKSIGPSANSIVRAKLSLNLSKLF